MKKLILGICIALFATTSCTENFEEINTDPNNPVIVPAHLLLGQSQRVYVNVLYGMLGGTGGDMGGVWAQHWSKVQYNDEERYVPRRGVIDNIWNTLYANVLGEAQAMQDLAVGEENTNLQGIAMVMKATTFQTLTELYGPIPFTQALDATNLKPAYDDEATVYAGVIEMYTQAAAMLASGTGDVPASSDLFYGGDTSKWLKLANSLKFRALMRVSNGSVSGVNVSAELQALANQNNMFSSSADEAKLNYLAAQPDANPIYETVVFGARPEYKMCSSLVTRMVDLNDPRLAVYAQPNASGVILGKPAGYGNQTPLPNDGLGYTYANISSMGEKYLDAELPGFLMSYSQLKFLMAEAANEGWISGSTAGALVHFTAAVQANFEFNGVPSAGDYIAQSAVGIFSSQADARTKIALQEWIALYSQGFEAWTEYRRTKVPTLQPAIEGAFNEIPSRYYYPTTEQTLNNASWTAGSQMIGGDDLTSGLIWQ